MIINVLAHVMLFMIFTVVCLVVGTMVYIIYNGMREWREDVKEDDEAD